MKIKCLFGFHNIKKHIKNEYCNCTVCVKKGIKFLTGRDIKHKCKDCGKITFEHYI